MNDRIKHIISTSNVWDSNGKIDLIKFVKLMSEINGISEEDALRETLDWLGIKYKDKPSRPLPELPVKDE